MPESDNERTVLDPEKPVWDKIFTVHPLVVIGTVEDDDNHNLAPKHMAFPLGWDNYFGFVCTPRHGTYQNIKRTGEFTVSYPKPDNVLFTSLTATMRCDDNSLPDLSPIPTFPATEVNGSFIREGYLFFECEMIQIIDNFGENSLILGKIIAAQVQKEYLRDVSHDESDQLYEHPLLAYIAPGRFAEIKETHAFPFPEKFKK